MLSTNRKYKTATILEVRKIFMRAINSEFRLIKPLGQK